MRIGIVADASCDLPLDFIRQHPISILPISIRLGGEVVVDDRDPAVTARFYGEQLQQHGLDAETMPFTAEQIRQAFLDKIVLDYDCVFVVTVTASRSPIFENATKAAFAILNDYKSVRSKAGITGHFSLRVVDSKSLFCGTAVLVAEAVRQIKAGASPNDVRKSLDELAECTQAFMVPSDLYYIRTRAIKKNDKSVSLPTYLIAKMLDIKPIIRCFQGETAPIAKARSYDTAVEKMFTNAVQNLRKGLKAPVVCVSYGGDVGRVASLPGFDVLKRAARETGTQLLVAPMSATAAVNTGAGGIALAFASEPRDFDV